MHVASASRNRCPQESSVKISKDAQVREWGQFLPGTIGASDGWAPGLAKTPPHNAWGGKGALMGCTRRMTGPTGTLPLPTADQTHTHTHFITSFVRTLSNVFRPQNGPITFYKLSFHLPVKTKSPKSYVCWLSGKNTKYFMLIYQIYDWFYLTPLNTPSENQTHGHTRIGVYSTTLVPQVTLANLKYFARRVVCSQSTSTFSKFEPAKPWWRFEV